MTLLDTYTTHYGTLRLLHYSQEQTLPAIYFILEKGGVWHSLVADKNQRIDPRQKVSEIFFGKIILQNLKITVTDRA